MSSANRVKLVISKENSWGETPATPDVDELSIVSTSLTPTKETVKSTSLRSDRQIDALPKVGAGASGNIDFEFSTQLEKILDGVLMADYTTVTKNAATFTGLVSIVNTAGVFTVEFAETADYTALAGANLIRIAGSATTNNAVAKVIARDAVAKKLTIVGVPAHTFVNETTSNVNLTFSAKYVRNGVIPKSYFIEVGFTDINKFIGYTGMSFNTFKLDLASRAVIKASASLIGKNGLAITNTTSAGTTNASGILYPLSASANVGELTNSAGAEIGGALSSFTIDINNNLRERPVVGSEFSYGLGDGEAGISGNFTAYFDGQDLYNAFINHTEISLSLPIISNDNKVFNIDLPRILVANAPVNVSGINTDVIQTFDYTALRDATKNYTIQLDLI